MNICIFCSAAQVDDKYKDAARALARMIAEGGHTLVWGGSDRGLMHEIATTAQAAGGRIFGVSMEQLKTSAYEGADTMLFAKDMADRKRLMLKHADAIVTMVGGTGTLDEFTDLLEQRRYGRHNKRLVILNTDNFFEGLKLQYERMRREGFLDRLPRPLEDLVVFLDTPKEVMEYLIAEQEEIPLEELAYSGEAV
ncbi:MAG TPA: TIGR00730 family Rossman fold protein [Candidatus Saccharimonadales bacterium]|nr:TIGR00730 family Rossman fold protein [Candidatus Saccharimonadales bacterium]